MTTERKITLASGAEFKINYEGADAGHPDVVMFLQVANEIEMLREQVASGERTKERMKLLLNSNYNVPPMILSVNNTLTPEQQKSLQESIAKAGNINLKLDHGDGPQAMLTKTRQNLFRLTGAALQVIDELGSIVVGQGEKPLKLLQEAIDAIAHFHEEDFDIFTELRDTLSAARNGLRWYRDTYVGAESGADDEMQAQIEHALGEEFDVTRIEGTISDMLDGIGASEDHTFVVDWFVNKGISRKLAVRMHALLAWSHCTPTRAELLAVIKSKNPAKYVTRKDIVDRLCVMSAHERLWRTSSDVQWRRLALQFDGHRMQAMGLLKLGVITLRGGNAAALTNYLKEVETFVAAPPLSGEAVLQQRIAEHVEAVDHDAVEREAWNAALVEADKAMKAIDDGDAPEYPACRQAVRELFKPAA